jgi:tetratricopeptide (TPR) repeat protein
MEYKWWRDPIPPDAEWSPPGFKKYLQDRIDGLFFWDKSITFRIEVYNSAIHMARDNILLGIGIGTFKIVHDLYTSQLERFVLGKEVLGRKVHDEYLTFAAMHGIFGLLALLWIQLIILKMGVRVFRQYRKDKLAGLIKRVGSRQRARVLFYLVLGLFWGMLINAFSQIFGHSLTIPTSHFLFWAMLGLLTCLYHEVFQTPDPPGEKAEEKSFLARLPGMETFNNRLVAGVVVSLILTIPCFYHWMGENLLQAGMQTRRWVDYKNGQIRDLYQKSGGSITREQERTASRYLYQIMMANVPRLTPEEPFVSFEDAQDKMVDSLFHHFEESIRMWPYHMETYYIFGRYCIDFEQWEKGVEVLTRDLFMNPNYKWAHNNIGVCFDRLGLHHRARDVYYRALIIDPQQIFAHFNLAQGYLTREKNHRLAAKHFKGVLDSNPKRLDVYGKLAYCLMQTDQYEEAAEVLGDYFYLKETGKRWAEGEFVNHDEQNYNFLLKIHKELDQPEKALEAIENLVRVAPQKIRYLQMYADELRKQGRNAEALEKAKVINQVQPGNVRVLLLIAELEMLVNEDAEKALEAIREAKSINEKLTRQLLPNLAALESLRSSPEYQELIPEQ